MNAPLMIEDVYKNSSESSAEVVDTMLIYDPLRKGQSSKWLNKTTKKEAAASTSTLLNDSESDVTKVGSSLVGLGCVWFWGDWY